MFIIIIDLNGLIDRGGQEEPGRLFKAYKGQPGAGEAQRWD
jgi:hypothetical protein